MAIAQSHALHFPNPIPENCPVDLLLPGAGNSCTLAFNDFYNHFSISFACILLIVIVVFIGATQVVKNYRKNESQEENPRKGWLRTFFILVREYRGTALAGNLLSVFLLFSLFWESFWS